METYFYLAVRLAAAGYILYRLWIFLFRDGDRLWKWIPVRTPKPKTVAAKAAPTEAATGVVGRTNAVVLSDPWAEPQPVNTTDLEPTGYIGEDNPITSDDIETDYEPPEGYIPSDEELYGDDPIPDDDPEFSSGITFEQIGEAVDVLTNPTDDKERLVNAAKTMRHLQNTDIFDFIVTEVSNLTTIENLIKECLDGDGFLLKKKTDSIEKDRLKDFDIQIFV